MGVITMHDRTGVAGRKVDAGPSLVGTILRGSVHVRGSGYRARRCEAAA